MSEALLTWLQIAAMAISAIVTVLAATGRLGVSAGRWSQEREAVDAIAARDIEALETALKELRVLVAAEHDTRREQDERLDARFDGRVREEHAARREADERLNVAIGKVADRLTRIEVRMDGKIEEANREHQEFKSAITEMRSAIGALQRQVDHQRGAAGV